MYSWITHTQTGFRTERTMNYEIYVQEILMTHFAINVCSCCCFHAAHLRLSSIIVGFCCTSTSIVIFSSVYYLFCGIKTHYTMYGSFWAVKLKATCILFNAISWLREKKKYWTAANEDVFWAQTLIKCNYTCSLNSSPRNFIIKNDMGLRSIKIKTFIFNLFSGNFCSTFHISYFSESMR